MNIAIILLAGNSSRIKLTDTPKQFVLVNETPIFVYATKAFNDCYEIDEIVLVTKGEYIDYVNEQVKKFDLKKVTAVIEGGKTRQESVYNALTKLTYSDNDIILIHDAARALISQRIIKDSINACKTFNAVTTAIKCSDTLVNIDEDNCISKYVDRTGIYRVQTPQTFRYKIIRQAHDKNIGRMATDDTSLVNMYYPVHVIKGDERNFKITVDEDIEFFKDIISVRNK